jgi:hypothetical protein
LDLSDIPAETLLELEIGLFQEGALWGISHPKCPKCPILDLIISAKSVKLTTINKQTKGGQKWLIL